MSNYCYPDTNVLINLADINDPGKLETYEAAYTLLRLTELYKSPITGSFDTKHLMDIHRYIFQDVYPFAGEFRTVNIQKGSSIFALYPFIESQLNHLLNELRDEQFLKNLDKNEFSGRLAYYFAELNAIHPFREGNGRAIREFIRCVSWQAGYTIDWSRMDKDLYLLASIESMTSSPEKLAQLFFSSIADRFC